MVRLSIVTRLHESAPSNARAPIALAAMACGLLFMAVPVEARPDWGVPGREPFPSSARNDSPRRVADAPARPVTVETFVAKTALAAELGSGSIEVLASADGDGTAAVFEAAVLDRLVAAGYDTAMPPGQSGQVTELRVLRREVGSAEPARKPVSGAMDVGIGNRGSWVGMAIDVDMSKPRGPLVATRLEARIRDRASNELLWEGRAELVTRDDDRGETDDGLAGKLAKALFADFPNPA